MESRTPEYAFWRRRRPPIVRQTEAAECGLACLAMIASHHGRHVDLRALRQRFSLSLKGTSLKSLITMSRALGLQARPLKLELEAMSQLRLPCVLHWEMNHFVVLASLGRRGALVLDPAHGERRIPIAQLARSFTGVALELTPGEEFRREAPAPRTGVLALMGRVVGLRRGLSQLLLLGVSLQVCALVAPFYMQWMVDEALVGGDRELVTVLGMGFVSLVAVQCAISAVRSWVTTVLSTSLNFQWFGNAFAHLLRLPLPYFEKRHLGDIVSRFSSIQTIQRSLTAQFVEGIIDGLLVLATLVVMFVYSVPLACVACGAVGLYALLRWSVFRALREATAQQIEHAARQQTIFLESARGIQSVRLFGRADERRIGWMNALAEQFNADLRIARVSISYQTGNSFLFGAERVVVIWMAALAVLDGRLSLGALFAFLSYKDQFSQRMASLVDKLFDLRMLRLHGERVADIVLTEPEEDGDAFETDPSAIEPTIEVRDLRFRYADGEPYVIDGLNLVIPAGQSIAITGKSGCGKSTLVKLLMGLMKPTSGEILVGGMKLEQLGLANYRRLVGTVMQDDTLFSGSIEDNIAFFDTVVDRARVQACAVQAAVHAEIAAMPMGYGTLVGDIGTGLSGGQRQRILLARALYRQPRLLVLDEATSHLDNDNEHAVNAAIRQISLTRIIVAHRSETIAMAQRVVVLAGGRIERDLGDPESRPPRPGPA